MSIDRRTLADIAQSSLAGVHVLERHGIDYCADSARSLREVCIASNLNLEAILEELSNAESADLQDREWTTAPLEEVIHFLAVIDHAHVRSELQVLSVRLNAVLEEEERVNPALAQVPKIFSRLRDDLEAHMAYEEREVFPAIERYIRAAQSGEPLKGSPLAAFGGPLRAMETEHEAVDAALRLMRNFAQNYEIPAGCSLRYRALLLGLRALEESLLRHMYIENNVLYPRAAALKAARKPKLSV